MKEIVAIMLSGLVGFIAGAIVLLAFAISQVSRPSVVDGLASILIALAAMAIVKEGLKRI